MQFRARAALALVLLLAPTAFGYVVNDLGDASDQTPGDNVCATAGAVCTLRAAIEESNAHAGADVITFSVAGIISPATAYPSITQPLSIDGAASPPNVIVDGAASVNIGFNFAAGSDGSSLNALQVYGFSETAVIVSSSNNTITRNTLGSGTPNQDGIQLFGTNNTVGGADGTGNVICGNSRYGILATGSGHVISDNLIGITPGGQPDPNSDDGIHVFSLATNITIGSSSANAWNVISGNGDDGVEIDNSSTVLVAGNFIGTDDAGTIAVGNNDNGVEIAGSDNTIGSATTGNVISGNGGHGVSVGGAATDIVIQTNIIGLDATGASGIGNFGSGVNLSEGVSGVRIGGTGSAGQGTGNVISFNGNDGITGDAVSDVTILGNIIGLDAAQSTIRGNGFGGILMQSSSSVTIGASGTPNAISGNSLGGIALAGGGTNIVEFNVVGMNTAGTLPFGNLGTGIEVVASNDNIIRSNLISGNDGHGIETTFGATGTIIHSNTIGLAADLVTPVPNTGDGVNVCDGSVDTVVGSVALGGNTIAGNGENGIGVEPTALLGNTFAANSIHDNTGLGIDLERDGVTENDDDDPDTGPNDLQNFPVLVSAVSTASASQIRGTINTNPSTPVDLHFYSSPIADPSLNGEGATYLGTVSAMTDAGGDASFTFNGPAITVGHVVTSTATSANGTSEFSDALAVAAAPTVQFSSPTYTTVGESGFITITVTRTGDLSAPSTVQYATSDNTATAGSDYTAASGTLTFIAGDASETFDVAITPDAVDEPNEFVNLTLSNPLGASLGVPATAQLTITDDDVAASANLSVTKNASSSTFTPGQQITFTIVVTNNGPSAATNVVMTDILPAGTTFVSANATTGSCSGTTTVTCTAPSLANGASDTITLVVTANGATPITNTATVAANETDPNGANNSAAAIVAPANVPPIPTLGEWALLMLALALAMLALKKV